MMPSKIPDLFRKLGEVCNGARSNILLVGSSMDFNTRVRAPGRHLYMSVEEARGRADQRMIRAGGK